MTDAALKPTATRFLFHFAGPGTANVIHERRTQNAGNSVLGDDPAQFVRCYSKQCQVKSAEFSAETLLLSGNSCYNGCTRQVKPE